MRSSTSSSVNGYKEMRPIEASYHNYSILTKPQQCCRRVKEALYQSWDADRNAGGKKDEGIIFVLRRHPQYPEVLEVIDSEDKTQCQPEHPRAFDAGELWEITSPCPSSFPLHCRDARGVIGPIPLTAMVLDRHQFCYRFHLAGNKMRWLAKRQGQSMAGLQCYVRGTVVALLLFGGCSAEGTGPDLVSSTGRRESWCEVQHTEDSHLPRIVVLPEAFSKLEPIDSAVVESFVLFTGIEVLECFLYNTDMV
ncbi:hypothetical protein LPJ81_003931 [Coemansia sp. IMI 209127]|nr:hypothetical protein LPJ81_003931 [Coemansia sp. IMI 209127]